ncbi:hypothetical protein F4810DRAFT_210526 [Camillea tinctor]|nr:hypothetical protein F4810DRAFT_210526 [Camillea tinctor]
MHSTFSTLSIRLHRRKQAGPTRKRQPASVATIFPFHQEPVLPGRRAARQPGHSIITVCCMPPVALSILIMIMLSPYAVPPVPRSSLGPWHDHLPPLCPVVSLCAALPSYPGIRLLLHYQTRLQSPFQRTTAASTT